jgi:16S rRNA (guanine1207-N2)-methyltransferase
MSYKYIINEKTLQFITHKDLFSPNSADEGTLAMLSKVNVSCDDKILDLGCGYGFVGIVLKTENNDAVIHSVDKDPLAIEYVNKNIEINNLDLKVWLSDGFENVTDRNYTIILTNPPYHTDFSVAKGFIENAFNHLVIGGYMIMVVKRLLWYKNKLSSVFGGVEVNEINDYYVLISQKRSAEKPKKDKKPIKKKQKKRLKRTKRRKKNKLK